MLKTNLPFQYIDIKKKSIKTRTLSFSNYTTSMNAQMSHEDKFRYPTKDSAVRQSNKDMILFINDVNMATVDF